MKKISLIIICLIFCVIANFAQKIGTWQISVGSGLSGIEYNAPGINNKTGIGLNGQILYKIPLTTNLGIGVGIGCNYLSRLLDADPLNYSETMIDEDGDSFDYNVFGSKLSEKQTWGIIEFPVVCMWESKFNTFLNYYFTGGASVLLPVIKKYSFEKGVIEFSGTYPQYNVELKEIPIHGFGIVNLDKESDLKTKITPALICDAGVKLGTGKTRFLVGLYAKYSLGSMVKTEPILEYPMVINSLSNISEKSKFYSFGIKIGMEL